MQGLLTAADLDERPPQDATYAVVSPPAEVVVPVLENGARNTEGLYTVPTPAGKAKRPAPTIGRSLQTATQGSSAQYSATASVGNDAVLESGASGL
jgi:hypothetical protein